MIKRTLLLLLVIAILATLICSCSDTGNNNEAADTYLSMAQDFVDKGDNASALDVLKKGYSDTKDERIAAMIEELSASNDTAEDNSEATDTAENASDDVALDSYFGTWAEKSTNWVDGGMILVVTIDNDDMILDLSYHQGAPESRVASVYEIVSMSSIRGDSTTIEAEDSWGNTATYAFLFQENAILCKISDIQYNSMAGYGMYEGEYCLYRNDTILESMDYTMEDYYELYPEEMPEPTYDMSKASGILASSGLTEAEFRNICTYINSKYYTDNEYVYAAGRQYYNQFPEENTLLDNYTEDWNDYQIYGSKSEHYNEYNSWDLQNSKSLDEYLNRKIYGPRGASILGKHSEETLERMLEYPADYANQPFLLKDFQVESIYNYTYISDSYVIYGTPISVIDYRDDVNYPNILNNYYYDMYVIFLGTSGNNSLVFALISVDKCD